MRIKLAEFILARSLRNGTKNTRGPQCVFTPHMQSKGSASASLQSVANFSYGYTLERITLSALKKKTTRPTCFPELKFNFIYYW